MSPRAIRGPGRSIPPAADLHVHSRLSDGTETPTELFRKTDGQLALIAICDHDTLAAYSRFPEDRLAHRQSREEIESADRTTVLVGIEVTATLPDASGIHLLGYFPKGPSAEFERFAEEIAADRMQRTRAGVEALKKRGLAIRYDAIEKQVESGGVWCRSHVCRAMLDMGIARNSGTIFHRFLRGPEFASPDLSAADAIAKILEGGGVPVWAHPWVESVDNHIETLVEAGLRGLEIEMPRRRPSHARHLRNVAEKHGLIATGGSDHHGTSERTPIGTWRLQWEAVPRELVPA